MKWIPVIEKIKQDVIEQELRLAAAKIPDEAPEIAEMRQSLFQPAPTQEWKPQITERYTPEPEVAPPPRMQTPQPPPPEPQTQATKRYEFTAAQTPTQTIQTIPQYQPVAGRPPAAITAPPAAAPAPTTPTTAQTPAVETQTKNLWMRALEVFNAPFEWLDKNIIKPGLGIVLNPLIPNLKREIGEDYFKWKRREEEAWKTPGITLKMPWGDWTVDVKGIAEFAPWFLIPGAGQIGGALRTAGMAAGAASKLGKALTVVGKVVQYSPWGLAEKVTGAVIGAPLKALAKKSEQIGAKVGAKFVGVIPEKKISPAILQLTEDFKLTVMPARKAFEAAQPALRAKQEILASKQLERGIKGEISMSKATALAEKARAGGIKEQFAVDIKGNYTPEMVEEILNPIFHAAETGLVKTDAAAAMRNLLITGELPEPHHILEFAKVYDKDFAEAVGKFMRLPGSARAQALDVLNLPRTVLASGDFSATLRQGLVLMMAHPVEGIKAFGKQIKAFASEKLSLDMDAVLKADPLYPEFIKAGGYIAPIEKGFTGLVQREESYLSSLAEKLPFVRRSERGFITHLNELRFGAYKSARSSMVAQGAGEAELTMLARFVNLASGRGDLPANLNQYAPLLNTLLFSPRLQMSRLELPVMLGKMLLSNKGYMRKEGARALVTFLGGGAAILGLLEATKVGTVEKDPRSADFGKLKIGDTRLDIWTGYVQYARFAAQMLAGERKEAYGNISKEDRATIAGRFLQSKTSPAAGLLLDLMRGETYMGEAIAKDTTAFLKQAKERLFPLALQDTMDAMEQNGINGLAYALPASLGIGVLTYVNDFIIARNKVARQAGFASWADVDPATKRHLEKLPAIQQAALEYDRQMMGTTWGDWRVNGNAIENNFTEDVNIAVAWYRAHKDEPGAGNTFREKYIKDAFTKQRGAYAARQKDERFAEIVERMALPDTAESLVKLGPEQMAIKTYEDALFGEDMYDEFGDYRFDEADIRKEQLRQSMGEELFNYVENYRGIKYEDLPFEYQELAKAKKVMKPYWQVERDVENIWGKAKNARQQKMLDAKIARIRARVKRMSPEIQKYYLLFYKQA